MTHDHLEPGTEYLVPANMDAVDIAGFRQRLVHARTLFESAKIASLNPITPPTPAAKADGRPLHQTEYCSGADIPDNVHPATAGDIAVHLTWPNQWGRALKIEHSATHHHRAFAVIEPIFADGSNDLPKAPPPASVISHLDRWIALLDERVVPHNSPALKALAHEIWPTIYALMQTHPGEIYEHMAGRLRIVTGRPFGLPQLVPNEAQDDIYSTDQFLTPQAAAILSNQIPTILRVSEKRSESCVSYTFSSYSIEEPATLALRRNPGSAIDTMKRLKPFAHIKGGLLVPDIKIAL